MNSTKKKTKQTKKNTESHSKKPSQSSKTRSSKSQSTTTRRKKDTLPSAEAKTTMNSLSRIAIGKKEKKKLSDLSLQENLQKANTKPFQDYDFDNLPQLTKEQMQSFSLVSNETHKKFSEIDTVQVLKNGVSFKTKKVGRPKKNENEKENVVSIRLSQAFIKKLKQKALNEGYIGWQTYLKHILEEHLDAS